MKGKWLIGGAGVVAIALILIGGRFGGGGGNSLPAQVNAINGASQTAAIGGVGRIVEAPDFTLTSLDGESITLSDYKGEKAVILDFFATWCPNCRRDMPKLSRLYQKYGDQVEVIGVNLQERESKVRKFVDDLDISFPVVLDARQQVTNRYGVRYTNYHVLINKEGDIVGVIPGDLSESHVQALVNG